MGNMGGIDNPSGYGPWRVPDAQGRAPVCHPGLLFSALGASRGTVLAQRLETQSPARRCRRPVASLAGAWGWAREARRRATVQPSAREPPWLGLWAKSLSRWAATRGPGVAGRPAWGV
jgi:hypothetical protein